jgi:hypothetical protein
MPSGGSLIRRSLQHRGWKVISLAQPQDRDVLQPHNCTIMPIRMSLGGTEGGLLGQLRRHPRPIRNG